MSVEDPFFVVKGEVEDALTRCRELRRKWKDILDDVTLSRRDDYDRISNELRNSIRSIEWDLEDLEETISIVEMNPQKFHIKAEELEDRKRFIRETRHSVQSVVDELDDPATKLKADVIFRQSLLGSGKSRGPGGDGLIDNGHQNDAFIEDQQQRQQLIIRDQDAQLDLVADSVGTLKHMSQTIGVELDEQATMLNALGSDIESTQNKLDSVLRKMAKVTHMSNDRRQWCAIGILGCSMFIIFILFFIL